ncbi:MAG: hypothetical protein LBK99_15540 [Opitutaceae bacterium]|jgi:hypothetical protein|nr:hypothetical protein [Opitutaceae bacterium]
MDDNSDFSDRTDALAHHLGIRIAELTDRLNLSRDSLMGYRTGRYPISAKAWRKLESAEMAAGILPKKQVPNLPRTALTLPPLTPAEREAFDKKTMDELTDEDWVRIATEEPEETKEFIETLERLRKIGEKSPEIAEAARSAIIQYHQKATANFQRFAAEQRRIFENLARLFRPPPPPKE